MSELSARLPDSPAARRVGNEQAVKLAVAGRWLEAAALNRELLARFGEDAEICNRLGKALAELGRIGEARQAYEKALALDPTNAIARRHLARLAQAREEQAAPEPAAQISRGLFIEEVGKAAVVRLEAAPAGALEALDAGDALDLEVRGSGVNVRTPAGDYVGMVEPRTGLRLARLLGGGNRYAAALVSTGDPPRIIVRETYQHPSQAGKVSFPRSSISEVRAWTRRNFLREDVADLSEDEDGPAEAAPARDALPEDGWTETRIDGGDEAAVVGGADEGEDEDDGALD